jgi:hypothetical protein
LESLIVGLLLALISGLTFLAYKHPRAFDQLREAIELVVSLIFTGLLAWSVAVQIAFSDVAKYIDSQNFPEAHAQIDRLAPPIFLTILVYLLILGYLKFLKFLPILIKHPDERREK